MSLAMLETGLMSRVLKYIPRRAASEETMARVVYYDLGAR